MLNGSLHRVHVLQHCNLMQHKLAELPVIVTNLHNYSVTSHVVHAFEDLGKKSQQKTREWMHLEGNTHQILLLELSLPEIEVCTDKLLPKILEILGKENPSKEQCKIAFVQRKCAATPSVSARFYTARTSQAKDECMHSQGSCECTHSGTICPSFYGSLARYQVRRDVTQHFNRPIGNLPGFDYRQVLHPKNFQE